MYVCVCSHKHVKQCLALGEFVQVSVIILLLFFYGRDSAECPHLHICFITSLVPLRNMQRASVDLAPESTTRESIFPALGCFLCHRGSALNVPHRPASPWFLVSLFRPESIIHEESTLFQRRSPVRKLCPPTLPPSSAVAGGLQASPRLGFLCFSLTKVSSERLYLSAPAFPLASVSIRLEFPRRN